MNEVKLSYIPIDINPVDFWPKFYIAECCDSV